MDVIIPDGFDLIPISFETIIKKGIPMNKIIGLSDWDKRLLKTLYFPN